MIECTLLEISNFINGKIVNNNIINDIYINSLSINSKDIKKNCLFLAFKGEKLDSHNFIYEAIKNGAIAIVSEYYINNNIPQIIVESTNNSLYKISQFIRNKSKSIFISITGSCGKTTIKEMLINILKLSNNKFSYTLLNNNNNIGVALTLINININDKFVIIEIGMNKLGQIFKSIKLVKPDIILINNIYISHLEKLKSFKNIILAKGEMFYGLKKNGRFILNYFSNYWNEWKFYYCNINRNPIFFSLNYCKESNFYSKNIILYKLSSSFKLVILDKEININLKVPGLHNICNAIAASSLAFLIGINIKYIKLGLNYFKPINNRLKAIYIDKNKLILDDTYNSNIESIKNSINVLNNFKKEYKLFVIGDMGELGHLSKLLHIKVSNIINNSNIDKVLSIGTYSKIITDNIKNGEYFNCYKLLIKKIIYIINKNKNIIILFKSSRNINLDKILNLVIEKYNEIKNIN